MEHHPRWKDRALGCILGGALGDAWGKPWEGKSGPIAFRIPSVSSVSDDTQLTLATCESIVETADIRPERIASQFARCFAAGRISGAGSSTLKALRDLAAGVHWALAGNRGEYSAGSGAAMRIAPLAFLLDPVAPADRRMIRDVCRITHHNDEAYVGALAVVAAIRSVLTGTWSAKTSFLASAAESVPDSAVRDRIRELLSLDRDSPSVAARLGTSGWVVDTVPSALYWAQSISEQQLSAVLGRAIEAGGDTDTIASIAGQIAGAVVGFPSESSSLVRQVTGSDEIVRIAERFADFVGLREEQM